MILVHSVIYAQSEEGWKDFSESDEISALEKIQEEEPDYSNDPDYSIFKDETEKIGRIRLLTAYKEESELEEIEDIEYKWITTKEPQTVGTSLHFISVYDFGVGYTSLTTRYERNVFDKSTDVHIYTETTSMTTAFLDFTYTMGDTFTITLGRGLLLNADERIDFTPASSDIILEPPFVETEKIKGFSNILGLGYAIGKVEILYRKRFNLLAINYPTLGVTKEIDTMQDFIGLGWRF